MEQNLPRDSNDRDQKEIIDIYIQLHPDGKFKMMREFDKNHYLVREIAYHPEPKVSGHHQPILHVHEYSKDF